MSLTTNGVLPLAFGVIQNISAQSLDKESTIQSNRARTKRRTSTESRNIPAELPEDVKLTPFELERNLHEDDRKQAVVNAMQFLQSRKILKNLTRNLEKIIDSRSEKVTGFNSKTEISKEDLFIKEVASGLLTVLENYPVYQNVQVVMGFIEMVNLIDKLEGIGIENERHEFGFRPTSKTEVQMDSLKSVSYAKELRARIPHLLEWLEVPSTTIAA